MEGIIELISRDQLTTHIARQLWDTVTPRIDEAILKVYNHPELNDILSEIMFKIGPMPPYAKAEEIIKAEHINMFNEWAARNGKFLMSAQSVDRFRILMVSNGAVQNISDTYDYEQHLSQNNFKTLTYDSMPIGAKRFMAGNPTHATLVRYELMHRPKMPKGLYHLISPYIV